MILFFILDMLIFKIIDISVKMIIMNVLYIFFNLRNKNIYII